jgi:hypothetical protein
MLQTIAKCEPPSSLTIGKSQAAMPDLLSQNAILFN